MNWQLLCSKITSKPSMLSKLMVKVSKISVQREITDITPFSCFADYTILKYTWAWQFSNTYFAISIPNLQFIEY